VLGLGIKLPISCVFLYLHDSSGLVVQQISALCLLLTISAIVFVSGDSLLVSASVKKNYEKKCGTSQLCFRSVFIPMRYICQGKWQEVELQMLQMCLE
jgi:hypothetical protein